MTFDNTNIACLVSIVLIAITPLHFRTIAPRLTSQPRPRRGLILATPNLTLREIRAASLSRGATQKLKPHRHPARLVKLFLPLTPNLRDTIPNHVTPVTLQNFGY